MRELTEAEIDEVSGGALNLATGAGGAFLGGMIDGAAYAANASANGTFAWSEFAGHVALGATSGFLIGSGYSLMVAGVTGAARGATVLGASMAGAGASLQVASSVELAPGAGGGSE